MNGKPLITVFTPSYNRKSCISKCYESLCAQTSHNFEWLIIDDGSTDDTKSLIERWQKEQTDFPIRYCWKENGGLHTAYNRGIALANTELFVCIDSDDWMPPDAIEKIESIWSEISDRNYVGIMGLDCFENQKVVGDAFPEGVREMYLYEKLIRYKTGGDKKMIHRTSLLKQVAPMPTFEGEKNFNPSYLMYELDRFGKLYVTNECFCIVEYQPDGMSSDIVKQYLNSPNSFAEIRKQYMRFPDAPTGFLFKQCVHYVSSCVLAGKLTSSIQESPCKFLTFCAIPFGIALSFALRVYHRRSN